MNPENKTRTIKVDYLARVEGEGALYLKIQEGKLEEVQLKIFEPPRFLKDSCEVVILVKHPTLQRESVESARLPIR